MGRKTRPDRQDNALCQHLMLVFRGPEAVWTLMSGWTQALGNPW